MSKEKVPTSGTAVEITVNAGTVPKGESGTATKFIEMIKAGQCGLYQGKHPGKLGHEDWHVISVGAYDVPLHRSQFRVIDEPKGR